MRSLRGNHALLPAGSNREAVNLALRTLAAGSPNLAAARRLRGSAGKVIWTRCAAFLIESAPVRGCVGAADLGMVEFLRDTGSVVNARVDARR